MGSMLGVVEAGREGFAEDSEALSGLFDGDTGDAPAEARMVITFLMRNRVLWGRDDPEMWEALLEHEPAVVRHFHNMYVDLVIDRGHRLVFKQQVLPDGRQFSIVVRAVPLTLEASVLALHTRERIAHAVPGETVVITREEARSAMEPYWPAHVANKAAKERHVNGAIDSLVQQDLLLKLGGDQWEVSPAVAQVLTAAVIERFTDLLTSPDSAGQRDLADVGDDESEDGRAPDLGGDLDADAAEEGGLAWG